MRDVRFLVVDDSSMMRKMIKGLIMNKLGSQHVLTANDGREALKLLENNPVDLIISDWNMIDMDGDELLYAIRHHERYKDTPFVMVTTNNQRDFIITALQLGVSQYVVKPFTAAELEQKIRSSWTAANKRRSERHSDLPKHRVFVQVDDDLREAEAVNISRDGILLRMPYDRAMALYETYSLSMVFEAEGQKWKLDKVQGQVARLEAENPRVPSCSIALEFRQLPEASRQELKGLIEYLASRTPKVIDA